MGRRGSIILLPNLDAKDQASPRKCPQVGELMHAFKAFLHRSMIINLSNLTSVADDNGSKGILLSKNGPNR